MFSRVDLPDPEAPGARRSHDGDHLAFPDFEVDALEYMQRSAVVVGLVDVFEYNHIERE